MGLDRIREQRCCGEDVDAASFCVPTSLCTPSWVVHVQVGLGSPVNRLSVVLMPFRFNIANVPPPPKHLLALASSSSLPPPPPASAHVPTVSNPAQPSPSVRSSSAGTFSASFKEFTPNVLPQESRRRNADQRAAALRADPLLGEVEPARVFCKLCQKWVQLRQDSTFCSYPWLQHRAKCLQRR